MSLLLLIVPYGIETRIQIKTELLKVLLIVPYGIETEYAKEMFDYTGLLIVPYGIETSLFHLLIMLQLSFNRTLWN